MIKRINKKRNKKGFTLVELVVVIAILGILAAIAVPRLTGSTQKASISAHNANVRTLESAATLAVANGTNGLEWEVEKNKDDDSKGGLGWTEYLQSWPEIPGGVKGKEFTQLVFNTSTDKYEEKTETIGNETGYKVVITDAGKIVVTPGEISE